MRLLALWVIDCVLIANSQFDRSACGSQKGCITYPNNCVQTGTACRLYFSYLQDSDYLIMEIFGQQNSDSQYYAIGFSSDTSMGDDTVVFCRYINGVTQAGLAYNGMPKGSNNILNVNNIQIVNQATTNNGAIYCNLRQRLYAGTPNVKNLNDSYNILVASGPVQGDGGLGYHKTDRDFLSFVDFRQYVRQGNNVIVNPIQGTGVQPFSINRPFKDWLKIIHGILMLFSWGLFLTTGILFARHFKNHWTESNFCGVKLWFAYHRTLNMLGLVLSALGVIAIFWALDWTWQGPQPAWSSAENLSVGPLHCLFGAVAVIIDANRKALRVLFLTGYTAVLVFLDFYAPVGKSKLKPKNSVAAITLAAFKFNTMFGSIDSATAIWSAYLVILIICEVILEVLKVKRWCTNAASTENPSEKAAKEGTTQQPIATSGFSNAQSYALLFFFIAAFCLIFALSVLIFLKPVRS